MCVLQPDRPPDPGPPALTVHLSKAITFPPAVDFQAVVPRPSSETAIPVCFCGVRSHREIMRNSLKLEAVFYSRAAASHVRSFPRDDGNSGEILAASRLCEECLRASLSPQLLWFQNLEFTGWFFFSLLATHCQGAAPVMSLPATITALSKQFYKAGSLLTYQNTPLQESTLCDVTKDVDTSAKFATSCQST